MSSLITARLFCFGFCGMRFVPILCVVLIKMELRPLRSLFIDTVGMNLSILSK